MAKNKVQFQKGFSLVELQAKYPSEEQCREALFRWRWPEGFNCPGCGHTGYCHIKSRKVIQCHRCHHQTSVISGTIFASTKLPLSIWFLAIYLITQSKDGISSLKLARSLGVSANTALSMKHKIQQVMKERDDSKPLSGIIQLDDAYWGGKKQDGKRGRGATGKTSFLAAVSTTDKGQPLAMRFSTIPSFSKQQVTQWAKKNLEPGCRVTTDGLNCFPGIRDVGCLHEAIVTGGGPESVKLKEFKWVNTIISNVKNDLRGTYHAISKKHLPLYLAEFCYRFNRRFDLRQMLDRFIYIALRTPPMPKWLLTVAEVRW